MTASDYTPSPRPTFPGPAHIPYEAATRHLWGDQASGEVADWIYVSSDKIHHLVFGLPPGGGFPGHIHRIRAWTGWHARHRCRWARPEPFVGKPRLRSKPADTNSPDTSMTGTSMPDTSIPDTSNRDTSNNRRKSPANRKSRTRSNKAGSSCLRNHEPSFSSL